MHESCAAVSVAPAGLRHQTEEASFLFKLIFKTKLVFYILSFFFLNKRNFGRRGCRGSIQKPSTKHADANWIGNVTPGKPFPRQLLSAASEEVKSSKKEKKTKVSVQTNTGLTNY